MFAFRDSRADIRHDSFPLFDWLRFVLASVVVLSHASTITLANAGNFSVQVFFALSGWLIGGILLRSERKDLPRFYFNRATRIWIPYALAVAVLYALADAREGIDHAWFRCLFYDGTFTHNWFIDPAKPMPMRGTGNHFWSIAVEEQFYLAAPLLIVLLPFGRSILLWAGLAIVAIVTHFWYGSISLGVLAAVASNRGWKPKPVIVAAIVAILSGFLLFDGTYIWVCSPLAAGIVLLLARPGARSQIGEFFGGISYPLYLYHWTGLFASNFLAHRFGVPTMGLLGYGLAVIVGAICYLAVDRNVLKLRGKFYHPAIGRSLMITAYSLLAIGFIGHLAGV